MKALLFASAAALLLLQSCGGKATTQPIVQTNEAIPVKLVPLSATSLQSTVEAAGLLATEDEASLSFKVGGIIENIYVAEGQQVRKGQLLATLKPTEVAAQVAQVQLSVAKAQRDYQRARNLHQDSVATLEQMQNAQTGLELAEQSLRQASFNKTYANIHAPADGFIVKKMGGVGEMAGPGAAILLMNAVSGSSRWVLKLGLPDKQWALVEKGDKAAVSFDAFPGKIFTASVSKKALSATAGSGVFEVELQPDMNGVQPGAGIFGKAVIHTSTQQAFHAIPYEALLEAAGREGFVFISNDRKTVRKVPVQIGEIRADTVYISGGLAEHAFLVTAGSPYLRDGSRIEALP